MKYNGYRTMVIPDGDRARLVSSGGHDYTKRFPWIVEAVMNWRCRLLRRSTVRRHSGAGRR
jgi:ATP-dependent DNA ligase